MSSPDFNQWWKFCNRIKLHRDITKLLDHPPRVDDSSLLRLAYSKLVQYQWKQLLSYKVSLVIMMQDKEKTNDGRAN